MKKFFHEFKEFAMRGNHQKTMMFHVKHGKVR